MTPAQRDYLRWLSGAHPAYYKWAVAQLEPRTQGLGWVQAFAAIASAVAQAGSIALQKKAQDKALKIQKESAMAEIQAEQQKAQQLLVLNSQRAAAGQPPVNEYGQVIPGSQLPNPSGIPGISNATLPFIAIGAAAIVGVLILRR